MSIADNCVPFERARVRVPRTKPTAVRPGGDPPLADLFESLTPAQYAFLNGVLAILAEHGEEALTRSCEMVIERFGRGHAD